MANTRLKICFVGSARYSSPLDRTTEKKFQALSALGELFVIGFSPALRPQRFTQHAHFYALPLLPSSGLRYLEFFVLGLALTLWHIFRHDCRVLIAQSPYEGLAAAIAKQIAGWSGRNVALIVESHGDFEHDLFLQRHIPCAALIRAIMRFVARFTLNRADALRSISTSTRQQLAAWRPNCKIVEFMAWTDIDAFLEASADVQKSPNPLLLYTGVLIPRKGVTHLLNAFASIRRDFPRARLRIIGREQDAEYVRQLKAIIREKDMTTQVEFMAEMPQQQLAGQMAQAHVFFLPSLSEGLGRVVVEAMAAGTPVIGSRTGGIPDLIKEDATGFLVPPGDEAALSDKMRRMLENPQKNREMGRQAHVFAEQFFSKDIYVQGYASLLKHVAASLETL